MSNTKKVIIIVSVGAIYLAVCLSHLPQWVKWGSWAVVVGLFIYFAIKDGRKPLPRPRYVKRFRNLNTGEIMEYDSFMGLYYPIKGSNMIPKNEFELSTSKDWERLPTIDSSSHRSRKRYRNLNTKEVFEEIGISGRFYYSTMGNGIKTESELSADKDWEAF